MLLDIHLSIYPLNIHNSQIKWLKTDFGFGFKLNLTFANFNFVRSTKKIYNIPSLRLNKVSIATFWSIKRKKKYSFNRLIRSNWLNRYATTSWNCRIFFANSHHDILQVVYLFSFQSEKYVFFLLFLRVSNVAKLSASRWWPFWKKYKNKNCFTTTFAWWTLSKVEEWNWFCGRNFLESESNSIFESKERKKL